MKAGQAPRIRVVVVDDSALVREGIQSVLSGAGKKAGIEVIGEAGTSAAGLEIVRRLSPDVALLDVRLPDGSGIDVCKRLASEAPQTRVLMLTSVSSDNLIYDAVLAGAQGYLMKEIDPAGLIEAITKAAEGKSVLAPEVTERVLRMLRTKGPEMRADLSALSAQEGRVLALVAEGRTNKEIAVQLNLSDNTVKNYLVSVFEKLQVKRRSQAAAFYVKQAGGPKG